MQFSGQSFGQALPDQVDRIADLFDAHLGLISDVRDLYRDRAALEREYAGKLQALAKKALEKKSKIEASIVVGQDPTKAWDDRLLAQRFTLNAAYAAIVDSVTHASQDHVNIADALTSQVADALKAVERQNEETKKKVLQFFQKLLSQRDLAYSQRLKTKQKYDEDCIETDRQGQNRAHDDRHADRAAKQAEQQRIDMLSSKNVYLISTAIANKTKEKFYEEDLPGLENEFQLLHTQLVERFTKILIHSQQLQLSHLDTLKSRISSAESALTEVKPSKDQDLFIEYNIRPFVVPADWKFEPCASHYDTEEMSVEAAPKVFLQNKLSRCRTKLQELGPVMDSKRKDFEQLSKLVTAYAADRSLGNLEDISDSYLEAKHQLVFFSTSESILKAEIETIVAAVGDDEGAQQPHSFKSSSFSIPTQCGYCQTSIWGLSKQGKTCKACGLSVHSKCELKVPAECPGSDGQRHSSLLPRSSIISRNSIKSRKPSPSPSSASSFLTATTTQVPDEDPYPNARMLFSFAATSEFELSVPEGAIVRVLEADDGSGWVKVAIVDAGGQGGLVPASYIEYIDITASDPGPVQRQSDHQGSAQHVRAIYSYESQGPDELELTDGEILELTEGPTGGQNYGDGWWEGINFRGQKGIFPSNYVEKMSR